LLDKFLIFKDTHDPLTAFYMYVVYISNMAAML